MLTISFLHLQSRGMLGAGLIYTIGSPFLIKDGSIPSYLVLTFIVLDIIVAAILITATRRELRRRARDQAAARRMEQRQELISDWAREGVISERVEKRLRVAARDND